jgi:hypothetical protein
VVDYFEKNVTLAGGAPYAAEWKENFVDKLAARYPFCVRDRGQRVRVHYHTQSVKVKIYTGARDVQLHTHYGSLCAAFGVLFLVFGFLSLLGTIISLAFMSWGVLQSIPGCVTCFIIAGILFAVNEEFSIHDQVIAIAKEAWKEVKTRHEAGMEVVKVKQFPGEKYPTAYLVTAAVLEAPAASPNSQLSAPSALLATGEPKEALYCSFCGTRHLAGARFCMLCGAEL